MVQIQFKIYLDYKKFNSDERTLFYYVYDFLYKITSCLFIFFQIITFFFVIFNYNIAIFMIQLTLQIYFNTFFDYANLFQNCLVLIRIIDLYNVCIDTFIAIIIVHL